MVDIGKLSVLIFLMLIIVPVTTSATAEVELISPQNNAVENSSSVTISCNASDAYGVYTLSLFVDDGESFGLYGTKKTVGVDNTSDSLIVCGFDGSSTCIGGKQPSIATGIVFEQSNVTQGALIGSGDVLGYPSGGNINYDEGTIELWLRSDAEDITGEESTLFSVFSEGSNGINLWNSWGTLYFDFYDYEGNMHSAHTDINGWSQGEWHHVAAIWDIDNFVGSGMELDLFIDGSNSSTVYETDTFVKDTFLDTMYVGSMNGEGLEANSLIDEFAIYGRDLTPGEIAYSYNNIVSDRSNRTANWTIALPDGTYTWTCTSTNNETTESWAATNRTFIVDASTPPHLESFTFNPSAANDIDPGSVISVTANVSDFSGVSAVMFQWKESGSWNNDTMDYNGGTGLWENAVISVDVTGGVYYYRIWSNDTHGQSGYSETYNVTAAYDYTWNVTPSFMGYMSGFVSLQKEAGNFTIENTGDDTLVFTVTDDWPFAVTYNGTTDPVVEIEAKGARTYVVSATLETTPNERNLTVTVAASHGTQTPSPVSSTAMATLNSFTGGPYITAEITNAPGTVSQGDADINLTMRIKNIGNETAENVTINWTLPDVGWTVTYGNKTEDALGNISPSQTVYATITVDVGSSAVAGAASLWINASDYSGEVNASDIASVFILCTSGDGTCGAGCSYTSDTDCEQDTGGGTGESRVTGVGTVTLGDPVMSVYFPAGVDVQKGATVVVYVNVSNPLAGSNVTNVTLSFSGYDARFISVVPQTIPYINPLEKETFAITVSAPVYMEEGDYILRVEIAGKGKYAGIQKNLSSSPRIVVSVHGVMGNESLAAIVQAESAIAEMQAAGLDTENLRVILSDAMMAYESGDFDGAKTKALDIQEMRDVALSLLSSIGTLEGNITEAKGYGLSVAQAERMAGLAKSAFERGDYARAQARITAAVNAYQLETKGIIDVARTIREFWPHIIALFACVSVSSFFARRKVQKIVYEKRLASVRKEKEGIRAMLSDLQERYYKIGGLSKPEYYSEKELYDRKLSSLSSEELKLRKKVAGAKGGRHSLEKWRSETEESMKKLQREFFEQARIGKDEYKIGMERLQAEMAQIEKELSAAQRHEAQQARKGLSAIAIVFLSVFIAASLTTVSSAGNITAEDALSALSSAKDALSQMQAQGFPVERINGTIGSAGDLLSQGDYALSVATSGYASVIKDKAFFASDALDEIELRLGEFSGRGFDVSALDEKFSEALTQFSGEDYEGTQESLSYISDALDGMERQESLEKAAGGNLLSDALDAAYSARFWIVAGAVILGLASVPAFKVVSRHRKRKDIEKMQKGRDEIKAAIRKLQEEYFREGRIGKKTYALRMDKHRKDLALVMGKLSAENAKNAGTKKRGA